MCCGTEVGAYLRLIDSSITQLKAQGPSRTCNESKKEDLAGVKKKNTCNESKEEEEECGQLTLSCRVGFRV